MLSLKGIFNILSGCCNCFNLFHQGYICVGDLPAGVNTYGFKMSFEKVKSKEDDLCFQQ
jgi:hypothetical protein